MITFDNTQTMGWDHAIRGMRNPMNSWDKSDSGWTKRGDKPGDIEIESDWDGDSRLLVGATDKALMMMLAKGGSVHAKYRRMIVVYTDITAPLYWWKEFDTYKVGTVANSCSTMHKIHEKEFTLDDFSHEHLESFDRLFNGYDVLNSIVNGLNCARESYLTTKDKKYWWQMIQLLPSSYNQKRTIMMNYEVLAGIYPDRNDHKLDEWYDFCNWIKMLPCSDIIMVRKGYN